MGYAVRIPDAPYVWLQKIYVDEGQSIAPGAHIADIMLPDGVVHTLTTDCWGVVAHVEKGLIDNVTGHAAQAENDNTFDDDELPEDEAMRRRKRQGGSDGRGFTLFSAGDIICHIAKRHGRMVRGAGLQPRPSPALRWRRLMGVSA